MRSLYFILFTAAVAAHLYATLKKNQYFRAATKGLILLLLLGFYLESVTEPIPLLVAALLLSWLGDLLLLGKGNKWFTTGGIAFMVSHLYFIATYFGTTAWANVPLWCAAVLGVCFTTAVVLIFRKLKQHLSKSMVVPMFGYLLINGAMNCCALLRFIGQPERAPLLTAIGALLFFISDSTLFFVRFNKNSRMKSHFIVMLTYCLGEFLIVLGLIPG